MKRQNPGLKGRQDLDFESTDKDFKCPVSSIQVAPLQESMYSQRSRFARTEIQFTQAGVLYF